ncbi:hypothetical protein FRC01_004904, partial [Tulasnella sp. 417]
REILNGISNYRIDSAKIKITDASLCKRGGEGDISAGILTLSGWGLVQAREFVLDAKAVAKKNPLSVGTPKGMLRSLKGEFTFFPPGMPVDLVAEMLAMPREAIDEWCPEIKVAVKMLRWSSHEHEESAKFFKPRLKLFLKSFVYELSLIAELSHPNIIQLVGFVENMEKGEAWIILPWEANGNVREFLQSGTWDLSERISLIQDTASGLKYLHSHQPPICHGDLKSLNILVNSSYQAVITDFGSARIREHVASAEEDNISELAQGVLVNGVIAAGVTSPEVKFDPSTLDLTLTGPKYSLRWTAPEVMMGQEQDLPSDMWAIGWICWEIITGKVPFDELGREEVIIHHTVTGKLPDIQEQTDLSQVLILCGLMSECWFLEPAKRMHASEFQQKVEMMPSTAPSGANSDSGGQKERPAHHLFELGQIYSLRGDEKTALFYYRSAVDDMVRKGHDLEVLLDPSTLHPRKLSGSVMASVAGGLGDMCRIIGGSSLAPQAAQWLTEARDIYHGIGNYLGTANALLGLGEVYMAEEKLSEAVEAFQGAHEIHSRLRNDLGAADALKGLGKIYSAQARHSEAEKVFVELNAIQSRISKRKGDADALLSLGYTYQAQSKFQEARKAFNDAYEALPSGHNGEGAGTIFGNVGLLYQDQGRYDEAEISFHQALAAYDRADSATGRARTLLYLGKLYHAQARYSDAEEAITEALAIGVSLDSDQLRARAYSALAQIFKSQSKHTEEIESLIQAGGSFDRIGHHEEHAKSLVQLGTTRSAQGMYAQAEESYRHAQTIFLSLEDAHGEAHVLIGLGLLYDRQGRFGEAEECLAQARVASAMVADGEREAMALDALMGVYVVQGKFDDAKAACMEACELYAKRGQPMSEMCAHTWELLQLLESSPLGPLFARDALSRLNISSP